MSPTSAATSSRVVLSNPRPRPTGVAPAAARTSAPRDLARQSPSINGRRDATRERPGDAGKLCHLAPVPPARTGDSWTPGAVGYNGPSSWHVVDPLPGRVTRDHVVETAFCSSTATSPYRAPSPSECPPRARTGRPHRDLTQGTSYHAIRAVEVTKDRSPSYDPMPMSRWHSAMADWFLSVCVRHEGIAGSVLLFQKEVTTPAVLPAVPYRGVRRRQRRGAKPSGQRILIREDGDRRREPRSRLPAPRRSGTRGAWYGQPR